MKEFIKFIFEYLPQWITLFIISWFFLSGQAKRFLSRVTKVKAGDKEIHMACDCKHEPERRTMFRRASDKAVMEQGKCPYHDDLLAEVKKDKEHGEETWMMTLKNTFYNVNEKFPKEDRAWAGLTYVWWGAKQEPVQNGEMKAAVIAYCWENIDVYKTTIKHRPHLALKEMNAKHRFPVKVEE